MKLAKSMEEGLESLRGFPSQDDDGEDEEREAVAFLDSESQHNDAPPVETDHPTQFNNPIVAISSGISGMFDVRRVVVTMIDPDGFALSSEGQ